IAAGDPAEQILSVAQREDAELIVMASHGRGALGRFVSGSVADRVVRLSPVPVMIIGPDGDEATSATIGRIIAPVDDSELSMAALPVAASLAASTEAPVTIVHVIDPSTDVSQVYPSMIGMVPPGAYENAQARMLSDAQTVLDNAVAAMREHGLE